MKACRILLLIFLSSTVPCYTLKAQSRDYVIKTNNDTLKGQFIGKKFKADGWDKAKRLDLADYKETYNSEENKLNRAVLMEGDDEPIFLPVLENGKISLYKQIIYFSGYGTWSAYGSYHSTGGGSHIEYYVAKGTDSVKQLDILQPGSFFTTKRNDLKILDEMLKDNKDVYDKLNLQDKFTFQQIRNLIHLYNTGSEIARDYVIKNKKDTIFCDIEPATLHTVGRYRANQLDRFTKIDATIAEYFLIKDSSTYVLKTLPKNKRPEYVKLLVKGRVSLYTYSMDNSTPDGDASLYVSEETGELVQIKHAFSHPDKSEKKAFTDSISDDQKLVEKLKNLSYDFASITEYIKTYNSNYLNNSPNTK